MVMASAGKTYLPAPAGVHQAVCVDVVDLGKIEVTFNNKTSLAHKIVLVWQIDIPNPENEGRRFEVRRRYTNSLNAKANLRKELESWRGRAFSAEELKGFELDNLLLKNCQLQVVHAASAKDATQIFANVAAIMGITKGMTLLEPLNYVRVQDRKDDTQKQMTAAAAADASDEAVPF